MPFSSTTELKDRYEHFWSAELRDMSKRDGEIARDSKQCLLLQTLPDAVWWWGQDLYPVGECVSPFICRHGLVWLPRTTQGSWSVRADVGKRFPRSPELIWAHYSVLASQPWNGCWKHKGHFFKLMSVLKDWVRNFSTPSINISYHVAFVWCTAAENLFVSPANGEYSAGASEQAIE